MTDYFIFSVFLALYHMFFIIGKNRSLIILNGEASIFEILLDLFFL